MTDKGITVNSGIAPLTNVSICMRAINRAIDRPMHLPGIVAFYGPTGWGKSIAGAAAANAHRAFYVECKSSWTAKALLRAILVEMNIPPARLVYDLTDQVAQELALSRRPLIIDEFDHMVAHKTVEIVRDIYEASGAPILLIGEERLERNLRAWERFHNRVLEWVPAQPASAGDVKELRKIYCGEVEIADDLLAHIREQSQGITRRICVNLEHVRQFAMAEGHRRLTLATWGQRSLFTGEAPRRA